jgi:hypothetical protein
MSNTTVTTVKITYQSNYNGCSVGNDEQKYASLEEQICQHAVQFYNDEGEFEGDIDDVKAFSLELANDLHPDEVFEFEEDSFSS